jgi:aldehyde dehydrogenase (NAD+)
VTTRDLPYKRNYIGGAWVDASGGERVVVRDPATTDPIAEVAKSAPADVDRAVAAARACVRDRALVGMRPLARGRMLIAMSQRLRDRKEELARQLTLDCGKRISEALSEIEGSARYLEYYGGLAASIAGAYIPIGDGYIDFVVPVPYGVTAHVIPWNYPAGMVARSLAPALAAGNAAVVKAPTLDPLSAFLFAELAQEAGFPDGAVNIIAGSGTEAGAALVAHPGVDQIVFTGSNETGRSIMRAAAERAVPCVLELGGKSAGIVFADADLDNLMTNVAAGIYENSGQVCDAMSRLVVEGRIYDEVVDRLSALTSSLSIGPGIEDNQITPLISAAQLDRVEGFVLRAATEGAQIATGGRRVTGLPGHYMAPTIVAGVQPGMEVNQSEVFGPVLAVLPFSTTAEAVEIANGTRYGLAAGVFTADLDRAMWCVERLEAGQVHVNEWGVGGVETPFGGFKASGLGREKGAESLTSYYQSKNVGIRRLTAQP